MLWIRIGILTVFAAAVAQTQVRSPKIWDDAALKEWATPVAGLGIRPYPVYHPDNEPPGYWEELQKKSLSRWWTCRRSDRRMTGLRRASARFVKLTRC